MAKYLSKFVAAILFAGHVLAIRENINDFINEDTHSGVSNMEEIMEATAYLHNLTNDCGTDNACGTDIGLASVVDTCSSWGRCACCMDDKPQTKCVKALKKCKKKGGKCAEALYKPDLKGIQALFESRGPKAKHQLDKKKQLRTNDKCESGCSMIMCGKSRGLFGEWGTTASIRIGLNPSVVDLAKDARVYHWNPYYPTSPFLDKKKKAGMYLFSNSLKQGKKDCWPVEQAKSCCIPDPRNNPEFGLSFWRIFLNKLNTVDDDGNYLHEKDGRRFTYVISAPQNSVEIEWRLARMEGETLGTVGGKSIHDMKSKHAWLSGAQDWVIWAGELWVQAKPGKVASESTPLNDLMIVMDANSGTFSPGAEYAVRKRVQQMIMAALQIGSDQVAVCHGPFEFGLAKKANTVDELVTEGDDPCLNFKVLYPDEFD